MIAFHSLLPRLRMFTWPLLVLLVAVPLAAAEPTDSGSDPQERASLEDLIQQGIRLRRAGNDEAALQVFHQAERRSPDSVRVLLHIATAAEAAGKWIECDAYFRKVSAHRDDPYFQRHRAAVTAIESSLAKRVGRFNAVGSPAGAEVRLNGELIGNLNTSEPQSVEAGAYVLEVSHPGYYRVRRSINILPAILTREAIDLNEMPPTAAAAAAAGGVSGTATSLPASADSRESEHQAPSQPAAYPDRWITWTLAGLSVAAAATSGVAFVIREQHADRWNDNGRCLLPGGVSREQACGSEKTAADRAERVGIISGAAAVVLGAGAVIHLLATGPTAASNASTVMHEQKADRRMACGFGLMSIACQGSF